MDLLGCISAGRRGEPQWPTRVAFGLLTTPGTLKLVDLERHFVFVGCYLGLPCLRLLGHHSPLPEILEQFYTACQEAKPQTAPAMENEDRREVG